MKIQIQVHINKPAEQIFSYISNFSNHKEMFSANLDSKQTSEGSVGVGTTMRNIAKFMGMKMEERFVVTGYELNKFIEKRSAPGSTFVTSDKMSLEKVNGGTLFTLYCDADFTGVMKLLDGFMEKQVGKILTKDMNLLKEKIESGNIKLP